MKTIRIATLLLWAYAGLSAQATTRTVTVSWALSASAGVTGYQVYRAPAGSTAFVLLTTTPLAATASSYADTSGPIGQSVQYGVVAISPACTVSTPVTSVCGSSPMAISAGTPVPSQPNFTITITTQVI